MSSALSLLADCPTADSSRCVDVSPRSRECSGQVAGSLLADKYRLESLLGEGGMGAVWRAFNVQLEVPVAIKLLRTAENSHELGERLRIEARASAKLVHPSIVRVFDIGEAPSGEPFIVMELLKGESLADVLARGRLSGVAAVKLLLPIAEALVLAHSRGVVHRDLKPDNIFVCREGDAIQPKLLDFGIAKVTGGSSSHLGHLTQSGALLGTPDYMSPEQAYGSDDVDHRSDIWSFCVVLYEAIAGRTPFVAPNYQALLRSIVHDLPAPLTDGAPVDPTLWALLERGLSKAPAERPASILDLGRELATWLSHQGVQEDATAASLELKWLSRQPAPEPLLLTPKLARHQEEPRSANEHVTLTSSVQSSGPRDSVPVIRYAGWRRHTGLLLGLAAGALVTLGSLAFQRTGFVALPLSAAPASAMASPVAVDPVAPEPVATARPVSNVPIVTPASLPLALPALASLPVSRRKSTPNPVALPRALPLRDPALDLMNPY